MAQLERATSREGKKYISTQTVTYEDLSTGGKTVIDGGNITTGNIQSNNYVLDTTGTKINLTDGTIDTKNFKVDSGGNVNLGTGAKIIGGDGLLTSLNFYSGYDRLGWWGDYGGHSAPTVDAYLYGLIIQYTIPSNFVIVSANVILNHVPNKYSIYDGDTTIYWGYSRNIKLYKITDYDNFYWERDTFNYSNLIYFSTIPTTEISSAFGSTGFTATAASSGTHITETATSIDIKDSLTAGESQMLLLKTSETAPTTDSNVMTHTGNGSAILQIIGYTSFG